MSTKTSTPENEQVDDRRAAIEAAFEEAEKETPAPAPAEAAPKAEKPEAAPAAPKAAGEGETPPKAEKPAEAAPAAPKAEGEGEGEGEGKPEVAEKIDRAPQSWKPTARAAWEHIDPVARAEIVRREHQIMRTLDETAGARRLADEFSKATQPFAARLQALNAHPLAVYTELLKVDHTLAHGTKNERAALIAKFVKDYDVDIEALDNALAGRVAEDQARAPQAAIDAQVERLLQERLAPFQTLLQREQQREQQDTASVATSIQQMAGNPEKYPYFHDVRMEMADILDLAASRGRQMTLDEAYNRAVMLDPEISSLVAKQTQAKEAAEAAARQNAAAQRARRASVSVGGAPSGVITGSPAAGDRRSAIEAAFEAHNGR